jgi:hypothetical protein
LCSNGCETAGEQSSPWIYSPFDALHFTTANIEQFDRDGAIWGANCLRTHELAPERLAKRLARDSANVFTVDEATSAIDHGAATMC